MTKLIALVKGGLGNQMFIYAAARRLAIVNDAELVLDQISGFVDDFEYRRHYMLDRFKIQGRPATPLERFAPAPRLGRKVVRWISRKHQYNQRLYIEQEGRDFDQRLLDLRFSGTRFLEGYWQSQGYFQDVASAVRSELTINGPIDSANLAMADKIRQKSSVALHVRWFSGPQNDNSYNASKDYYQRAIEEMEAKLRKPNYFIFSDDPAAAMEKFSIDPARVTLVQHNKGDESAHLDLWLMSQCQHFIIANSTFSWWGAWLGHAKNKIIIAPQKGTEERGVWGFKGLVPNDWRLI